MPSITVAKCRFWNNKYKHMYLKKERHFLHFLLNFWNVHKIYNILKKKEHPSLIITEIIASERYVYLSV